MLTTSPLLKCPHCTIPPSGGLPGHPVWLRIVPGNTLGGQLICLMCGCRFSVVVVGGRVALATAAA